MAFKNDHLTKFDQLNRFAKQQTAGSGPRVGAASAERTRRMIALGESEAVATKNRMRSSAQGVKNIFRASGDGSDTSSLSPELQMASWVQSIEEDSREAQENRPKEKVSPFAEGSESTSEGVISYLDFDESMIDFAKGAVSDVESLGSGGYSAIGPVVESGMYKGQRAYGKYQVMEGNIGTWTKKHYGTELTPEQFLENQEAQDAVIENELMGNWRKHGTIEDAVSVWFTGRPIAKAGKASDGYTTVAEYLKKFRNNYVRRFNEDLGDQE